MKYRILRYKYGWTLEKYQSEGGTISRGRHVGKEKKARWTVVGYHLSVKNACLSLLDKAAGDALASGEATTILEAIEKAKTTILEHLEIANFVQNPTPVA